jgi:UDP-3-O-[3-hydroxymyristoyl] glucosamine N-acyltransferase
MDNPFFKNNGPFKFSDILKELKLVNDQNIQNQNVIDIKDLLNSKLNEITFFHSKKYKTAANNTKATFCITTKSLQNELPKSCIPIIVDNVLVSTSILLLNFIQTQ